ncbi:ATP-dependent RecD-like DNA helicase [Haliangium ochraceum]|uniref:Helicase, RecD/TraA family n=1 Tax=Haliangium ochraceum (strain DSM 14365 / JCM 11303 / SMP-2) TaxID=502025 RepID=D0LH80_HALO1|nr:ATP-dependent RecD-like DNA helicase [Haliangium ochraceum]ACY18225.1 helicase, RecD/TraA family [Haliangium ochraceum DSM 14365]
MAGSPGNGPRTERHRQRRTPVADDPAQTGSVVEGTLTRIVYENADTHWTVARVRVGDDEAGTTRDPAARAEGEITVVGSMVGVAPGTPLRLRGTWEQHNSYGRQFRVHSYQARMPETIAGLERYLGSGEFRGIGPELAKRIVEHFGLEALSVIEKAPKRLQEVDGIGAARAEKIAEAWTAQRDVHDVMVFLRGYGVTASQAARIHKRYGNRAEAIVRENPYRLALDIWGIGFKTADSIAQNLGMARDAPERLEAGLIHVLGKLAEDGHVHVPEPNLLDTAAGILEVDAMLLPEALDRLETSQLVVCEALGDRGTCVSLTFLWQHESDAAARYAALVETPMRPRKLDLDQALAAFEAEAELALTAEQRRAALAAVMDKSVVLTGGPGVGKTTIVRAIVFLFERLGRSVTLAAPTGRAAKRLAESTARDAATIHRLLEFQPAGGGFFRSADNPLDSDVVIIDETSMVDIALLAALLDAMPASAQLVLVGDIDQLPSVGPGAVLADLIASRAATVVRLTEIFRQARESRIVMAAHEINSGMVPQLAPPQGTSAHRSDFYFISREQPVRARETIVDLVAERIPEAFGFDPLADIQVLCPVHRGELGTIALNRALQERLTPAVDEQHQVTRGERSYRVGDKVMQLENDYDRGVFNGDIGVIFEIAGERKKVLVDYMDGRVVGYEARDLDQLTHAYAISVHKSQGSEYPVVVLPLATQHYIMLQRNLLYTAVTRGKSLVVIVGSAKAVRRAVENQTNTARWTWLAERIREQLGE